MKKNLLGLLLALTLFTAGCVVTTEEFPVPARPVDGDFYGSMFRYADGYEYVNDGYGYTVTAYCSAEVEFEGWIDSLCGAMTVSRGRYATLLCAYTDSFGYPYSYYSTFRFPTGYISEYCSYGAAQQSTGLTQPDDAQIEPTTQPVVADGRIQAVTHDRVGPKLVSENLGRNVTFAELVKTLTPAQTARAVVPGKEVKKLTPAADAPAKK